MIETGIVSSDFAGMSAPSTLPTVTVGFAGWFVYPSVNIMW